MRPSKIVLLVVGSLVALVGLGLGAGGAFLVWAHAVERGDDGYYTASAERYETSTYALTSEHIDLDSDHEADWSPFDDIGTARLQVTRADGGPVFVGIAPQRDVGTYLASTAHDELLRVDYGPFDPEYRQRPGDRPPAEPGAQTFWAASAAGPGRQTVTWDIEEGDWAVVVMNADGSRGVTVDAAPAVSTGLLLPFGLGLLAGALVVGAVAAALLFAAVRRRAPSAPPPAWESVPVPVPAPTGGAYPVRLDGRLEPQLNRGLWLVKWFLAIPHLIVLTFLWIAVAVLTVVAGFSILFTGRYPRDVFDFNVGVMRWTWRVTFYALTLGTDRYPPFSLQPDAGYPADLAVDYPATLSRRLVLVKWWLLALPHYLIVAVFGGGMFLTWGLGSQGDGPFLAGAGLIGILVLIAAVTLAFTGRYPASVFDFVLGMQRWTYRVMAYAALMRDEYPPFRLDPGGADPGSVPAEPAPTPDDRSGRLVGV